MAQATISQHLKALKNTGIIQGNIAGRGQARKKTAHFFHAGIKVNHNFFPDPAKASGSDEAIIKALEMYVMK